MVAWRRDGKELFYYAPDRGIMSVSVSTSPAFEFGKPKLLFKAPNSFPVAGTPGGLASISRDGQRFALVVPPSPRLRQITVLDRQGKTVRKVGEPGLYDLPALSPVKALDWPMVLAVPVFAPKKVLDTPVLPVFAPTKRLLLAKGKMLSTGCKPIM